MAYTPTTWKDRVVEKPRTYMIQNNPDGTITLIPAPGTIYEPGTAVSAANMNKIEQGLQSAAAVADAAMPKSGGNFTGSVNITGSSDRGIDFGNSPKVAGAIGVFPGWSNRLYINTYSIDETPTTTRTAGVEIGGPVYVRGGELHVRGNQAWHRGDLRWNASGYLEYNDGGTWKSVSDIQVGRLRTSKVTPSSSNTWVTVVNISGTAGKLYKAIAVLVQQTGGAYVRLRVTIDGVQEPVIETSSQTNPAVMIAQMVGGDSAQYVGSSSPITFFSSLKVEVYTNNTSSSSYADVEYALKLGSS